MSKLIIITSPNHDEFSNYWKSPQKTNIVFNGQTEIDDIYVYRPKGKWDYTSLITNETEIVLLHESNQNPRVEIVNNKQVNVCYYSTLEDIKNLWSYKELYEKDQCFEIPNKEPDLPMDKLCWALNQKTIDKVKIDTAIDAVIEFFKKKVILIEKLNLVLEFLHKCLVTVPLLPEGIDKDFGKTMYQGQDNNGSIGALYEKWVKSRNEEDLSILRDVVLEWAEK